MLYTYQYIMLRQSGHITDSCWHASIKPKQRGFTNNLKSQHAFQIKSHFFLSQYLEDLQKCQEPHKGETLAKALRSICNFLPRFTRAVGEVFFYVKQASIGNSGLKQKKKNRKCTLWRWVPIRSMLLFYLVSFSLFPCFRWWSA